MNTNISNYRVQRALILNATKIAWWESRIDAARKSHWRSVMVNRLIKSGFITEGWAASLGIAPCEFYKILEELIKNMRLKWEKLADGTVKFNYMGVK